MNAVWDTIWSGIAPEMQDFFGKLNWTYIIMLTVILYGVAYKREFE